MCLNHPALVQKHPTHLASSVKWPWRLSERERERVFNSHVKGSAQHHRASKVCRVLKH